MLCEISLEPHESAASGHCTAREVQAQRAWPRLHGEPLLNVKRRIGGACHLCTRPSLHSPCRAQCTILCEP